ncbi:type III pantothenate kinase [Legionella sp. W05-934-2]|uniref:type III pantothenate kinase n=1 Tax=Legionella sp. W05-934-2 TaxID=1198649 RepID=UPI003463224E
MMLCIDVGNSHIYGGVFAGKELRLRFRHTSKMSTSDEFGIFLKSVLRENNCSPDAITQIAFCSVVPNIDYSLRSACLKYFGQDPFILQPGVKTGLKINYRNPLEVGADRIANAIAAVHQFPQQPLIIIDFGTATTFCAVTSDKNYLGGAIIPGCRLSVEALSTNTARLPSVEIIKCSDPIGRSTIESIQSGIYYSVKGACKEIVSEINQRHFPKQKATVLATGGFAVLFEQSDIFDILAPNLVLEGIRLAALSNNPEWE